MLIKGWGVPTATDISLAWMFALLVFGAGHPTINFLLLMAIVDDAIGMMIIAIAYPNPAKPVEPIWLLFVLGAIVVAWGMRQASIRWWQAYIFIAGPISWFGLLKAHVHPALALSVVVPFMPANHARLKHHKVERKLSVHLQVINGRLVDALGKISSFPRRSQSSVQLDHHINQVADSIADVSEEKKKTAAERAAAILSQIRHAPLHEFEHKLKLPVDLGMFFFGLANAGVPLGNIGGITLSVVAALVAGKTLGIAGFGLLAVRLGFALPAGVSVVDLFAVSALGGVGLTVALFVANEAFVDPGLQAQAKMGAVISVASALLAWTIKYFGSLGQAGDEESVVESLSDASSEDDLEESPTSAEKEEEDWIDEAVLDDILQTLWTQRRYDAHGTNLPLIPNKRSASKQSNGTSQHSRKGSKVSFTRTLNQDSILVARSASKQSTRRDGEAKAAWMPSIGRTTSKDRRGSSGALSSGSGSAVSDNKRQISLTVTVEDADIEQDLPPDFLLGREQVSPEALASSIRSLSPRSVT
jgi:NhaA family Na+:H+ antiporter